MFRLALSGTQFLFDGCYYKVDGIAMGTPMGQVLANLFMRFHEKKLATRVWSSRSDFVEKFVGNIICIFNCESDTENIFLYLNLGDKNILFTFEKEQQNKKISFLYVLIFKDVLILASKFQFIVQSINRLIY